MTMQQATSQPTERDRAIAGVRESLRSCVDRGLFPMQSVADHARALLASSDGDACAFFLRERLVPATDKAMLAASTPTQQQAFHAIYEEARYRLSVVDQLDWRSNFRAWNADGAVFDQDTFQKMEAEGGYRAICADKSKQLDWQDVLDHVLQTRFYAIRSAFVSRIDSHTNPEGVAGRAISLYIDNEACSLVTEFDNVGAGRNVAGLHYVVRQGDAELVRIDDRMAMDSADMAVFIRRQAEEALRLQLTRNATVFDLEPGLSEA
ncbi:MAG: hypothetical protein ACREPQ_00550 [Rhodanobacter sp.]